MANDVNTNLADGIDLLAVGKRLEKARNKRPLELIEQLSGVKKSTLQRAEKGLYPPQVKILAFYKTEGISSDLLLYGEQKSETFNAATLRILAMNLSLEERAQLARDLLGGL